MKRLTAGLLVACGLVLGASAAYAAFFSTATTPTNSFTANSSFCSNPGGTANGTIDVDSYVDSSNAGTNYGANAVLQVDGNATKIRRAYVHFSLPAVPSGCIVASATFSMNDSPGGGGAGRTHNLYIASATWTENGLTWTNQPGFTGSATSVTSASGWVSWTATAQTQALYDGTNTGFVVKDASETAGGTLNQYSSRTGANPPTLSITWG